MEIAATSDFMDIVVSDDVGDTIWKPDLLFAPGHATALYWRVSVFDRLGFLGLPSESRRLEYPPPVIP